MKRNYCYSLAALIVLTLASCDSPELVRKRDEQSLEIARLRGELAMAEEKLKVLPPDRSEELVKLESDAAGQVSELQTLEKEIADLEARKRSLEKEFEDYKRKYVIR